jgi:hypothetical protein
MDTKETKKPVDVNAQLLEQVQALRNEVTKLQAQSGLAPALEESDVHYARIRLLNGKPLVDWGKSEVRGTDKGAENLFVQVFYLDDDGTEKEEWINFKKLNLETPEVLGKIVKTDFVDKSQVQGTVNVASVEDYRTVETGMKVALKVVLKEPIFTIEMPDGKLIKARKVNI